MVPTLEEMGILRLSREERLALVQAIWDSIVAETPPSPLSAAQREELARRVTEEETTPEAGLPWEEVNARALRRLNA
jgi:putative addiction module component (TIGR02574 family)